MTPTSAALDGFAPRRDDPLPLHQQVAAFVRARIRTGRLAEGTQLPAEPELSTLLGVSRGTLRRAIASLIADRMVVQHHGRGTFVATGTVVEAPFVHEITSLAQSFGLRGVPTTTSIRSFRREPADERRAVALAVAPTSEVHVLDRVRSGPDGPTMWLVNVMRPDVVGDLDVASLDRRALYDAFEAMGVPPASARRTFEATLADHAVADALGVPVGHPILHVEQLTLLGDGRPLEVSDVWIRGDRLKLQVEVRR